MKKLCIGSAALWILILAFAGCKETKNYTLVFSHALHVKDNGMACADCHGEIKDGMLGRPGHDVCSSCHEDNIKTNAPSAKACGMCHKEQDSRDIGQTPWPSAGIFTHTAALKSECAVCHEKILVESTGPVVLLIREEIVRIRQQSHAAGRSCETCHLDMSPFTPPANHRRDWIARHGRKAGADDAVCGVCHQGSTCLQCHQVTRPSSHNTLWRTETHGIEADWNRAKCQVCHQQDFCIACHTETRPRSHNAEWRQTHCENCHTSESMGTGCATCHEGGLDAHPNPHPAGWLNQHCDRCHDGTPWGKQCDLCHPNPAADHRDPHNADWIDQHCAECHF